MIKTGQALVPTKVDAVSGNGDRVQKSDQSTHFKPEHKIPEPTPVPPLTDELVDATLKGRGLQGWLRAANIGRVLGLLSLYLFLDTYDVRASFNSRTAERLRKEALARGRRAQFQEWSRNLDRRLVDKMIRGLRFLVFRGADGSA